MKCEKLGHIFNYLPFQFLWASPWPPTRPPRALPSWGCTPRPPWRAPLLSSTFRVYRHISLYCNTTEK